jgi:hypothetical protein
MSARVSPPSLKEDRPALGQEVQGSNLGLCWHTDVDSRLGKKSSISAHQVLSTSVRWCCRDLITRTSCPNFRRSFEKPRLAANGCQICCKAIPLLAREKFTSESAQGEISTLARHAQTPVALLEKENKTSCDWLSIGSTAIPLLAPAYLCPANPVKF